MKLKGFFCITTYSIDSIGHDLTLLTGGRQGVGRGRGIQGGRPGGVRLT